jgi:hypothetical protein
MVTPRPAIEEAQRIAQLTQLDVSVGEFNSPHHESALIAIHKMVLAEIISKYTLIDEELSVIIQKYFLGSQDRTKKCRVFRQRILDELYLIKKMEIVHAIKDIPKNVRNAIYDLNGMRNAYAHGLHPETSREHKTHKKVFYRGKDIRTYEGLKMFMEDTHQAHMYLWRRSLHLRLSPWKQTSSPRRVQQ